MGGVAVVVVDEAAERPEATEVHRDSPRSRGVIRGVTRSEQL